jgi:L-alanine-DL-glutamate epimerase-like enolase superfamily enzyme
MKIVKFEDFHVDCGWEIYSFLKVSTDEGIHGWAEFRDHRRPGVGAVIHAMFELLKGQDPRAINAIDALLYSFTRTVPGGVNQNAAGAILNACLDIAGKALGVPCYDLFGGAVRTRIPVYWSRCGVIRARCAEYFDGKVVDKPAVRKVEDLKAAAREAVERGYKAVKCNLLVFDEKGGRQYTPGSSRGPGHPELNLPEEMLDALLAQLSAMREGGGPKLKIAVDLNFNYKTEGFKRIAKKVEPFDLMWLEMDSYEPQALALIRQSTTTPIASLETILGRRALKPYLEAHCADTAIIDPQYNGVPEAVKMAAMCDAYEVNVASHYFAGPLAAIICAHYAAVIPNLKISEYDVDEVPWKPKLLTHPPVIENGMFVLPTGPGWGTDVNEDELRAHAVKVHA